MSVRDAVVGDLRLIGRTERSGLGAVVLLTVLSASATAAWPLLVGTGVDAARAGDERRFQVVLVALCTAVVCKPLVEWARLSVSARVGERVLGGMRSRAFAAVQSLDAGDLARHGTGNVVARLSADVDAVTKVVTFGLAEVTGGATLMVVAAVALLLSSPAVALGSLAAAPLLALAATRFARRAPAAMAAVRERVDATVSVAKEDLGAHRLVTVAGRQRERSERFQRASARVLEAERRFAAVSAGLVAALPICFGVALAGTLVLGAVLIDAGRASVGEAAAAVLMLVAVWAPLRALLEWTAEIAAAGVSFGRIATLSRARPALAAPARGCPAPRRGSVVLDGVKFAYVPGRPVLRNLSLELRPGERVVLAGPSGAGKSTLAGLIARRHDPDAGSVAFAGVDLRSMARAELRERIVMVPQSGFLARGTIRDNVRLAAPELTDAELRARLAQHPELRARLECIPGGLDAEASSSALSPGLRQIVAVARVLVLDPAVVVLDEPTAHLDERDIRVIQATLERLGDDRVLLVIAHHEDTARRADRLLVLDAGQIVHDGVPTTDGGQMP